MNNTIDKVRNTVKVYNMISPGDKVLVGFSGGADSLFLLLALLKLKSEFDFTLCAAHLNHGIRGDEADSDEEFVKKVCDDFGVKLFTKNVNIPQISAMQKISEECAGRNERYLFFNELCAKYDINKIAVAHNKNDSVETVFLNLIRGSSLNGLCGIKPVNNNIIRPIIEVTRTEIETYLDNNNFSYCIDSTNSTEIYTRNKIRNNILKTVSEINPSIIDTVYSNLKYLNNDRDFLDDYCNNLNCIKVSDGEIIINKTIFNKQHIAIKSRIVMEAFNKTKGNCNNITNKHVEIICDAKKSGNTYNMPDNVIVRITHDSIVFSLGLDEQDNFELEISPGNTYRIQNFAITCNFVKDYNFKNKNAVYIDADKVKNGKLVVRSRKNGDRFIPYGMKSEKKLKQYFNDIKIPPYERNQVPILTCNDEIVAVVPYRISDKYSITKETINVIELKITKEETVYEYE